MSGVVSKTVQWNLASLISLMILSLTAIEIERIISFWILSDV